MASVTWSTKEEVLKDLARASGRRMRKKEDLSEGYLVIGDAPPPMVVEDEDSEMHLLYGKAAYKKSAPVEDTTPDLQGIQNMLRMVQIFEHGDDDDNNDTCNTSNRTNCVIAITKASKLNPNVQEFIPKSSTSSSTTDVSSNKEFNSQTKLNENVNEYGEIVSKLKDTISEAAKSNSFEQKKQKNVAIATLLRLYAGDKGLPKKTTDLKLITPEYFESKKDDRLTMVTKSPLNNTSSSSSTPDPQVTASIPTGSSTSISSTPLPSCSENRLTPSVKVDPEIKRSIEKVNKWLGEPKCKSPTVCLEPIAFKRKDPVYSFPVAEQKVSKALSGANQRYQPTKFAADLAKQYTERNKKIEEKQKEVTWNNLEHVLKQKDLEIKKRLEEQ